MSVIKSSINTRSEDFQANAASLRAQENMPAFHLQSSLQARTTTLYSFHVGGQR